MQVFLSWSGDRSRRTAEAMSLWLKQVIQALDPWMSPDIEKGKRWSIELAGRLEKASFGIICLDKDNLNEKWILFEAGALSKMITESNVCTFLLDIGSEDIESPLADFQNTKFEKEDMRKLVHTLNSACSKANDRSLEEKVLDCSFETYWPRLEEALKKIIDEAPPKSDPRRDQREMLVEILGIVRSINREMQMTDFVSSLVSAKLRAELKNKLTLGLAKILADPPLYDNKEEEPSPSPSPSGGFLSRREEADMIEEISKKGNG